MLKGSSIFVWPAGLAILIAVVTFLHGCQQERPSNDSKSPPATLADLLPVSDDLARWARSSDPEIFGPDDLYEYINGQAPFFLDYGFRAVVTAEYSTLGGDHSLVIDIYEMAGAEEAFGVFAAERSPADRPVEVGVDAYAGSNLVAFWKGPYYVKLISYAVEPGIEAVLLELGHAVEDRIHSQHGPPRIFDLFPDSHRVARSERFIPRGFLGQSFLQRGYHVDYDLDGAKYRLVLVKNESPLLAADAVARYTSFLESQGQVVKQLPVGEPPLILAMGGTITVIFQHGVFFAGVMHVQNPETAEKIATEFAARLPG